MIMITQFKGDYMKITEDIIYIGVNDYNIDLFEGQYAVPNGMAYNSYIIFDEKIAVMDTVDAKFTHEWLDNLEESLQERKPDYLIIHHMEPDHSANILNFIKVYPETVIVANAKTFSMLENFFNTSFEGKKMVVKNGETLSLGKHQLTFTFAPMVHWPEVMVTYDSIDQVLFSADSFGKFGALDVDEEWESEARRYYFGVIGKYGMQVQALLKSISKFEIKIICPLHGPVLKENLPHYLELYDTWSSYQAESEGVMIAYTSVYGHTKKAVELLAEKLRIKGCPRVVVCDLARTDLSEAVKEAFKYNKLILGTTTYNADIFPFMKQFIEHLVERNYQNRTIGFIENGSWAPRAAIIMKEMLASCKNITWISTVVSIMSAMKVENIKQIDEMAKELCIEYEAASMGKTKSGDLSALFKIGYGLYVVTCNDGKKDNGLIVNTVSQVTNSPNRIAVTINKESYSYHMIRQSGKLNINCLSTEAPFSIFENFGFHSGRNMNKFTDISFYRSENGLSVLSHYINAFISLKVEQYVDLDTHGMFICSITELKSVSEKETMTYTYYQNNVKPAVQTEVKKGFVCKICGFIYEGDELPEDFICPICKHGVADFEPLDKK